VPLHQSKTVHQQFGTIYGNLIFQSSLIHPTIRHGGNTLITPIISGGIADGRESYSARKTYARHMQDEDVYSLHRPIKTTKTESVVLSFLEEDDRRVIMPHDDALVVIVTVANHAIHRILVDNGSSVDILYWPAFKQMGID
jgi:hypothetical protein